MECHFTYDPTFLVLRLFEVRYDKKYYDSHDVPLNTIFCDWITNKTDSLYDKFCNYMERKNQDTINTENIDNFVEEMVNEWKDSTEYLSRKFAKCASGIYEEKAGFFKECSFGHHQDTIIEWLEYVFPKGYEYEEIPNIIKFTENSLSIKGEYFSKEKLIKDSVEMCYWKNGRRWGKEND
jgi:hypothetical protein